MRWLPRALLVAAIVVAALGWPALAGNTLSLVGSPLADEPPIEVEFRRDVEYAQVGDESLRLDLSMPKGATGQLPAIVVIHGGAWRMGDRHEFDELTWRLAQEGFVAATVSYRFCPAHRFPAQVQDVQCAVRFLRAHAEEFHIDPARLGAVGFSAGAHLALMLGALDPQDGPEETGGSSGFGSKVQAVVSFFAPTDLELPSNDITRPLFADLLGGSIDEARDAYRRASPVSYLDVGDAPMLLFHGTSDPLLPVEHATRMADEMRKAGVKGRVELLIGLGHGEDWGQQEFARTSAAMLAFFRDHLGLPAQDATAPPRPVFEGPR